MPHQSTILSAHPVSIALLASPGKALDAKNNIRPDRIVLTFQPRGAVAEFELEVAKQ